jgi:hypothetical protein
VLTIELISCPDVVRYFSELVIRTAAHFTAITLAVTIDWKLACNVTVVSAGTIRTYLQIWLIITICAIHCCTVLTIGAVAGIATCAWAVCLTTIVAIALSGVLKIAHVIKHTHARWLCPHRWLDLVIQKSETG